MAQITLNAVAKTYPGRPARQLFRDVSLDVGDGEFVVLVGPSGCGKSTLLRMIAGLEDISGGEIRIDGVRVDELAPVKRGLSMVFQNYALYGHMSVFENIAFGLRLNRTPRAEIERRVREAAELLQIGHLLERRPPQLSGGQRQRVAIGRAIVRAPRAFLFDEPLSNLDAALRADMRVEIARLHQRLGATMVYVTHDQVEAMTLADRIVVMGPNGVEQIGAPMRVYERPANVFVAGFIGSPKMNLFPARHDQEDRVAVGEATLPWRAAGSAAGSGAVTAGVRPEHLLLAADGPLRATLLLVERLGAESLLHLAVPGLAQALVASVKDAPPPEGSAVRLDVRPGRLHLFDAAGMRMAAAGDQAAQEKSGT